MKNLSLLLTSILALAVAVLFYLHFASKNTGGSAAKSDNSNEQIVYVNTDTLLEHYEFFKKAKTELQKRGDEIESELAGASESIQNEYASAQNRINSMSATEAKTTQDRLERKQQALLQRKEQLNDDYNMQMKKMNDELTAKIHDFLKEYSKDKGYKFILGYTKSGEILYAKDALDITQEVLKGMNEAYKKEKGN